MKKIDRYRAKKALSNKEYKWLSGIIDNDKYSFEGITFYPILRKGFKCTEKTWMSFKIREFKTWKHNRRTQYRN